MRLPLDVLEQIFLQSHDPETWLQFACCSSQIANRVRRFNGQKQMERAMMSYRKCQKVFLDNPSQKWTDPMGLEFSPDYL